MKAVTTRVWCAQRGSACAQEAAPSGYSHRQAGEGRQHAQSWSGAEAPAYAQTGSQSAAADFVERSDPPRIRVVVRKRPLNQKVWQALPEVCKAQCLACHLCLLERAPDERRLHCVCRAKDYRKR